MNVICFAIKDLVISLQHNYMLEAKSLIEIF